MSYLIVPCPLNREMDAYLWEDRIVFDLVHFNILIQASLSYNHIYMFCIISLLYWIFIYLHYFIDLTAESLNENFET